MLELLKNKFIELKEDLVIDVVQRCLRSGINKYSIIQTLNDALDVVGMKFQRNEYTIIDLMMAGIIYEQVSSMKEIDFSQDVEKSLNSGLILLGTVEGDLHDIGKSIFKNMVESVGFNTIDLGTSVPAESFCRMIKTKKPNILGISIILTNVIENLKDTISEIKRQELRGDIKIIIGGNAIDEGICRYVGADAYATNATIGANICKKWMDKND